MVWLWLDGKGFAFCLRSGVPGWQIVGARGFCQTGLAGALQGAVRCHRQVCKLASCVVKRMQKNSHWPAYVAKMDDSKNDKCFHAQPGCSIPKGGG